MDAYRTPDEHFEGLPGWNFEPRHVEQDGLRMHYVDEGSGDTVLLLHGEPTWGFLYRKLMPPLLDAGYRCVLPDLPGFGRSDKPTDDRWYSYGNHTRAIVSLLEELDLRDATLVMQDWGGPIGFRVATLEAPAPEEHALAYDITEPPQKIVDDLVTRDSA